MNHADVRSRMADYLDGDLPLDDRALVDAHLDACERCALDLSELQGTVSLLRSLPTPEPPPGLADSIIERLRAGEGRSPWQEFVAGFGAWLTPLRLAIPATAMAAGAAALFVASGQLESLREPPATAKVLKRSPVLVADAKPRGGAAQLAARSRQPATQPAWLRESRGDSSSSIANTGPVDHANDAAFGLEAESSSELAEVPRLIRAPTQRPRFGFTPNMLVASNGPTAAGRLQSVAIRTPTEPESAAPAMGRERRLDERLRLLRHDPAGFEAWMSRLSAAEQELWLFQIAKRASEQRGEDPGFLPSAEDFEPQTAPDQVGSPR